MDNKFETGKWLNLTQFSLPVKTLFTGYLIVIGIGLIIAGLQILLTHGMADGKFGISVKDIVYSYYGNREGSRLEKALNGPMKQYASPSITVKFSVFWVLFTIYFLYSSLSA